MIRQLDFSRWLTSVSSTILPLAAQVIGAELIVIDLDILIVDAGAVQAGNRLAFQFIRAVERYLNLPCAQALRSRVSVSATSCQLAKRVWLKLLR